jgi:hypothetical protein
MTTLFAHTWRLGPDAHGAWLRWLGPALCLPRPLAPDDDGVVPPREVVQWVDPLAALPRPSDRASRQRLVLWPQLAAAALMLPMLPTVRRDDVAGIVQAGPSVHNRGSFPMWSC